MIGKYQLNFLEQDLREAFEDRQKPMQRKMNFISGTILLIIQLILAIRMGIHDNSFHLVYISTIISFINIFVNIKYQNVSQLLIVLQTIILNISFLLTDYQDFVLGLLENKAEMFLVGLGYGHLHCIIFQSLHKWYIRGITAIIICICGFCWSYTSFSIKLAYLVPLYLSTIFVVIAFFLWERYEKENFCLLFIQNKSLIDWQRIIKENIPQSMVFVTCPKKKPFNQPTASKTRQLKDKISNFCGKLLPKRFRAKWITPAAKDTQNNQNFSINAKLNSQINQGEDKEKNKSMLNKKGDDDGLVFNFVNKKFYDQFQIKDWVETQRKSITQNYINLNFHYSFGEMIKREDPNHQQGNLICSESPIHQILFNSIFKNIMVSSSTTGESKTFMDIDNSGDPTQHSVESMQSLSEYLKQFIEEKENEDREGNPSLQKQSSKTKIPKELNRSRYSYSFQNPKQLSCFYRQSSPFFVLGSQFLINNQENDQKTAPEQYQQQQELQQPQMDKKQSQISIQNRLDNQMENKASDQVLENVHYSGNNNQIHSSPQSHQLSKNLTANFGTQISKQFDTKFDIENHIQENNIHQSQPNVPTERNSIKKSDQNGMLISCNQTSEINQNLQNPTFCAVSPTFSGNKNQHPEGKKLIDDHLEYLTERKEVLFTHQQDQSQQNLKTLNEDKQFLPSKEQIERITQKQVTFSNNDNILQTNKGNTTQNTVTQNQNNQNQNENDKLKNGTQKYNNLVQNVVHNNNKTDLNENKDRNDDRKNRNSIHQEGQDNAFFFDTQMVRCLWGSEEGVLLIFNDVSLKIINEKLREIERFKDKMLSTVTHDLKTPLNSIIMILENSFELGGLNKKQRKIILQNSQMLMSLINDILDYSQLRRDKFRLIVEEICLTQCIMDVVDLFEIQAEQKRIKITPKFVNLQQEYIMQDERRIKQILVNLIGNAIKFTQQEGKIDVIVKQKFTDCIQISVKDTGTGISEQIQKKLFQFFNTFDHSERANNRHGIGLGLAICKQLNTQLGPWHEIKLKSKVEKGSKFTFCVYTNLIDHQQVGEPLNIHSPNLRKATFDNTHLLFHNQQGSQIRQKDIPQAIADQHKLGEEVLHSDVLKSPKNYDHQQNFLQLPHPPSIHHLSPQQLKQRQLLKNGQSHQSPENVQEKSQKSDFCSQHELHSKSVNSPNNNHFNKSLKIEEIQTDNINKQLSSLPHSRDIQSNNQTYRKDSKVTQKKNSIIGTNPQQQHSTSIIKYQDSKLQGMQPPRRQVKRDYILLKGSRHKLLNQQKAFTMKLMMEDLKRKNTMLLSKAQTVDPFVKKSQKQYFGFGFPSNQKLDHIRKGSNNNNNQFYSEKMISSPTNQQRSGGQGVIYSHMSNKPYFGISQTINNITTSIPTRMTNPLSSTSNFNPSIYMSDKKRLEKKMKEHNSFEKQVTHLHILQQQRQMSKETNDKIESEQACKNNMFVRVIPKNSAFNTSQEHNISDQKEIEISENNSSENFGENEELYKKIQRDFINENKNNSNLVDKDYPQIPTKGGFQGYNEIQFVQSIPVHNTDNFVFSSTAKAGGDFDKGLFDVHVNTSNPIYQKKIDDKQLNYIGDMSVQQRNSIYDNSKQFMQFYSKGPRSTANQLDNKDGNLQEADDDSQLNQQYIKQDGEIETEDEEGEEEEEDEEEEERFEEDSEQDYENNNTQQHINKDLASNLKYYENNIEKQMIWIQNDRKLQVEILKSLLQDYQRILIADDSPFNIFCLQQILTKNPNLTITVAYNGNEALNSYKQFKQQIIFMDLNMPVLDGYECLKCIRQYEEDNHIEEKTKVIVISAQEYEPFFSSFDGYLGKPIKLIDIINLLQIFRSNLTNTTSSQAQL